MDAGTDLEPVILGALANRGGATDGARRSVEEGQEAITRGRDLQAAVAVELTTYAVAVASEDLLPRSVPQPRSQVRRAHNVCHEQRGDDALSGLRRFSPAAHAGELDGHIRLVADDSRQVTRRNVECLAGVHDAARAAVHLDLDLARQGYALMVVLAGRSAGDRPNVLRPAPTRLVHLAGDIDLAEDHDLHTDQRLRDDFVRLVERLAHDSHRARIRRGPRQPWTAMGEMIMIATMLDILIRYGYGLANRDVTWDCQIVTNQEQMAPSPFRDRAVSYLEVPATDIAQSSTFYRQVFGWAVSSDAEQGSFTDGSGHVIGHWRSDLEVAGDQGIRPYIYVSNLSQVIDEVAAHGGTVVQPRYTEGDLWVARFSDPAGNIIGVWQQIPSTVEQDN